MEPGSPCRALPGLHPDLGSVLLMAFGGLGLEADPDADQQALALILRGLGVYKIQRLCLGGEADLWEGLLGGWSPCMCLSAAMQSFGEDWEPGPQHVMLEGRL